MTNKELAKRLKNKKDLGGFLQNIAPLISLVPGAQPIGTAASIFGQLSQLDSTPQRAYDLNQMQLGGPLTKDEEAIFQEWRKSLPENLQVDDDKYDLRQAWKGGLEPELIDDEWHLGSRNPETGQLLKSPDHPTYDKMIQGEINAGYTPSIDLRSGLMKSFGLGGDFKQYKAPSHSDGGQMIDKNGNPTNQSPIAEIEKEENSYKGYVYSDKLINDETGNTFAKDASMVNKKTSKKDDISQESKILQLMKLRKKNEMFRQLEEAEQGDVPQAANGLPIDALNSMSQLLTRNNNPQMLPNLLSPLDIPAPIIPQTMQSTPVANANLTEQSMNLNPLAAGLKGASLLAGGIDALKGSETERLQQPDYSKGDQYYQGLEIDMAPILGEINQAETKAVQDVTNQASGIGARNSRVASILARSGKNAAQAQLQQQQANAGIRGQLGAREDAKAQTSANERIRQQIAQSQNDANSRLAGRKFFSDLSQVGTSLNNIQYANDLMKNQNDLSKQQMILNTAVLANKYSNFQLSDDFIARWKDGKLTEDDKPMLDKLIQFNATTTK